MSYKIWPINSNSNNTKFYGARYLTDTVSSTMATFLNLIPIVKIFLGCQLIYILIHTLPNMHFNSFEYKYVWENGFLCFWKVFEAIFFAIFACINSKQIKHLHYPKKVSKKKLCPILCIKSWLYFNYMHSLFLEFSFFIFLF